MKRALLLLCLVASSSAADDKKNPPSKTRQEDIVMKVAYFQTKGPCINLGNGVLAMPSVDAFKVLEVSKGTLPKSVKTIEVRPDSGTIGALKEGEVYLLHLTPSVRTQEDIKKRKKDDTSWLFVDSKELRVEKAPKK